MPQRTTTIRRWRTEHLTVRPPKQYSSLAQLAEHLTVNQVVAGSSPAGGAKKNHIALYAPLAQLVEQLTLNQWVQGSSPWRCTSKGYMVFLFLGVHLRDSNLASCGSWFAHHRRIVVARRSPAHSFNSLLWAVSASQKKSMTFFTCLPSRCTSKGYMVFLFLGVHLRDSNLASCGSWFAHHRRIVVARRSPAHSCGSLLWAVSSAQKNVLKIST